MSLRLYQVKNSNLQLRDYMKDHYSKPQGFVGRNLCYLVYFNETCYGAIVAGSATLHLAGRDDFFGLSGDKTQKQREIRTIINNTFFHLEKVNGKYPIRWQFTSKVLAAFLDRAAHLGHKEFEAKASVLQVCESADYSASYPQSRCDRHQHLTLSKNGRGDRANGRGACGG